jgi:hypothetical protein
VTYSKGPVQDLWNYLSLATAISKQSLFCTC